MSDDSHWRNHYNELRKEVDELNRRCVVDQQKIEFLTKELNESSKVLQEVGVARYNAENSLKQSRSLLKQTQAELKLVRVERDYYKYACETFDRENAKLKRRVKASWKKKADAPKLRVIRCELD